MEQIISINLETSTAPIIQEVRGRDYIEYGTDEWKNLYPQFLIDLYYNSSTHASIINSTAEMIAGEDLIIDEEDTNLDIYVRLKNFFSHANSNESLHQVIKKVAFDFKLQGAYALHIVWNVERTAILEIFHVPVERVRAGKPTELGKIDTYYISSDWSNTRTNKPYAVAAFNTTDRTSGSQLLYTGSYSPNMDIYHTPDYLAANNWALVDQRVAEFHLNNINNSFSGSYMFSFANGIPSSEERLQIENSLTSKFTGASNAGKFVLTFSDDRSRSPEVTPLNTADLDKQYLALQELLVQNILTGHRVTSKTLMGIDSASGFSSNADELLNASNFYQNTVIRGFQQNIENTLHTIFSVNQMDLPISFVQLKPITIQFDSATIRDVMTQDEIRESIGLAPLESDKEAVKDEFSDSKFTVLESYLNTIEDIPEDWELIEEEKVGEEHEDFDFEQVLNEIANEKTELASTGTARPNSKSSQDGVNESYNEYYKVRYVYTKDTSLSQEGKTRDFCNIMTDAQKIYRKEDIVQMGSKPVNKGWGPKGASDTYSIWFWKGGGNCHHYFNRLIFKTSLRNAKGSTSSADLVSYAKARSEGFTAEKNDSKVAQAPKTMKNNGFINK
tara:strand:- start:804 stop:2651 length:1848 start_codon:yes stop_codon:yes gene_type:complete